VTRRRRLGVGVAQGKNRPPKARRSLIYGTPLLRGGSEEMFFLWGGKHTLGRKGIQCEKLNRRRGKTGV